jgi:type II secretory pathway predicted ATPase ExeA
MYQEHFGLTRAPFKITPDTSLFYEGSNRGAALEALVYAINSGEGIIKVVGEVGSGKTMLCRMLELRLSDVIDVVYIANPSLSPDNILHVIAHELRLDINNDSSKLEVMQKLQEYLLNKHADNRQVVLFVEEAQSMPVETLEEIRLLSNLETEQNKLLQMVLFGQPELDQKLAQPHIRQLKERITHSFYLDPFPPKDTLEYLNFRLRNVGYRGPDVFNQNTANAVEKYSGGLTRRINVLADKALMASFSEGGHAVTSNHVKTAALDSDFKSSFNKRPWYLGAAIVCALGIAVWLGTLIPKQQPDYQDAQAKIANAQIQAKTMAVQNSKAAVAPVLQADKSIETAGAVAVEYERPGAASAVMSGNKTLLQESLERTKIWLEGAAPRHYTIQLFLARYADGAAVEDFLLKAPESLDLDKIYVYETVIGGGRKYSVLYNGYASRLAAQSRLDSLPAPLRVSQPFLRRVDTIAPQASGAS